MPFEITLMMDQATEEHLATVRPMWPLKTHLDCQSSKELKQLEPLHNTWGMLAQRLPDSTFATTHRHPPEPDLRIRSATHTPPIEPDPQSTRSQHLQPTQSLSSNKPPSLPSPRTAAIGSSRTRFGHRDVPED